MLRPHRLRVAPLAPVITRVDTFDRPEESAFPAPRHSERIRSKIPTLSEGECRRSKIPTLSERESPRNLQAQRRTAASVVYIIRPRLSF